MGAQVSFTSLYSNFISDFTEVINSLLGLSCDSLAMLCKHIYRVMVEKSVNLYMSAGACSIALFYFHMECFEFKMMLS